MRALILPTILIAYMLLSYEENKKNITLKIFNEGVSLNLKILE